MAANKYLSYLQKEIHTVTVATVDAEGLPVTCAIDIMDSDEGGLCFLTAKGKGFYDRLKSSGYIALTGMKGKDTLSCVAISVRGKVCELGNGRVEDLINKNPYMKKIYPTEASRRALTVFCLYEGRGEWFDLSKKPIERASFTVGNIQNKATGFEITDKCNGCGTCKNVCPQNCIDIRDSLAFIRQQNCLHCGNCFEICPKKAVVRR